MAYRALYRKYRPQSFGDVVGQEHIVTVLKNELKNGKIFHAYLFTGPRGTGKTSCAKILAKAVNCLDLNDGDACCNCDSCKKIEDGNDLDILEMDAASNRGIDNIRDLREQVNYPPAYSKYRVYIIDEVHMLSNEAFNALLKTLEEPPKHVVFILATTEVHKLPATILSRCQRFDFKRIEPSAICDRLKFVAKKEGLSIDEDAAVLISALADGGLRDALSMLDICAANSNNITENDVRKSCAIAGNEYLLRFVDCVLAKDSGKALSLIDELYKNSVDMQRLCRELITHYRNLMIAKTVDDPKYLITCSSEELNKIIEQSKKLSLESITYGLSVMSATLGSSAVNLKREDVELAAVKLCSPQLDDSAAALIQRINDIENALKGGVVSVSEKRTAKETEPETETEKPTAQAANSQPTVEPTNNNERAKKVAKWNEVLDELFRLSPLMTGVLTDSSAYIKGDYLLVDCDNSQFLDLMRSKSSVYRDSLRTAAQKVLGVTYKIGPYKREKETVVSDPLSDIKNKLSELEVPEKL